MEIAIEADTRAQRNSLRRIQEREEKRENRQGEIFPVRPTAS